MSDDTDLAVARRAARAGAAVGLRYFAALADLPHEVKVDGTIVTAADRAVETEIRAVLAAHRPDDAVLGEEQGQTGTSGRRWIVDPIDGTAEFVAGSDRWLVLLALEEAGEVVAAVCALPAQGRAWWAARGAGAFVGGPDDGPAARLAVDHDHDHAGLRAGIVPDVPTLTDAEARMVASVAAIAEPTGWAAHPGLLVAEGRLDLAVQLRGKIWDHAAPALVVEEAGGRFAMLDGDRHPAAGTALYARDDATLAAARRALTEEGAR
jgi:histidinol-phosphatase